MNPLQHVPRNPVGGMLRLREIAVRLQSEQAQPFNQFNQFQKPCNFADSQQWIVTSQGGSLHAIMRQSIIATGWRRHGGRMDDVTIVGDADIRRSAVCFERVVSFF